MEIFQLHGLVVCTGVNEFNILVYHAGRIMSVGGQHQQRRNDLAGRPLSKYGQPLDEIGEVLENGLIKGKYSKRTFDPSKAGGAIKKLDWRDVVIDKSGIDDVKKHLSRLESDPWNDAMIKRLEDIEAGKIQATDYDKRFYTHELDEFNRYKELGYENQSFRDIPDEVWDNAHPAALEDYQVYELIEYEGKQVRSLYHPDVQN